MPPFDNRDLLEYEAGLRMIFEAHGMEWVIQRYDRVVGPEITPQERVVLLLGLAREVLTNVDLEPDSECGEVDSPTWSSLPPALRDALVEMARWLSGWRMPPPP